MTCEITEPGTVEDPSGEMEVSHQEELHETIVEKECSESSEKEKMTSEENEKNDNDQDVVLIQDLGFTIKVSAPGIDTFDIQV